MSQPYSSKASKRAWNKIVGQRDFIERIRCRKGIDQSDYWFLHEDFVGKAGDTLPSWLKTQDTSAAGSPTLDYVTSGVGGTFTLTHDAQSEAQNLSLYGGDSLYLQTDLEPFFECRAKLNTEGAAFSADQRLVMGLAAARNATLDSIATMAWFRIDGANFDILTEVDDNASGNDDDNDSSLNWSDNAYARFRVSLDAKGWAIFEVDLEDGAGFVQAGVPLDLTVLAAGAVGWQPFIELQRDAGTEAEAFTIDYLTIGQARS